MRFNRKTISAVGLGLACAGRRWMRRGRRRRRPVSFGVDHRRRVEHGLPDQQGRPGGLRRRSSADVTVVVDNHGTGGGFGRYLQGEVDIVDASRDRQARRGGEGQEPGDRVDPVPRRLRRDHRGRQPGERRSSKSLTVDQLKKLFEPGSARSRPGRTSTPRWPDRKIVLYSPDNDSGTFEFFTEAIIGKADAPARRTSSQARTTTSLVNGVASDPDGLGYFGYAYYAANKDRLAAPWRFRTAPTPSRSRRARRRSPTSRTRRLSRPLFIYVKNSADAAARGGGVPQVLPRQRREAGQEGRLRPADRRGRRRPRPARPSAEASAPEVEASERREPDRR